jgi:hypothetical protein
MSIDVQLDDTLYDGIGHAFVVSFLRIMIGNLVEHGCIAIDANCSVSKDDDRKIFELAFAQLAQFENLNGIDYGGYKYFIRCFFSRDAPTGTLPASLIGSSSRTALHGNVDDGPIRQALLDVCAARTKLEP